jgi:hypothetical protein
MRSSIPAMLVVAGTIVSSAVIASANQLTEVPSPPPAPIGHAQPRAEDFAPRSRPNQEEQDRLSTFDAQQQRLDEMLDRKLSICRC